MIRFSNGHELDFCCGSGALAFDGRGWWWEWPLRWLGILRPKEFTVVAKTVTLEPVKGNLSFWHPWTCVQPVYNDANIGAVNAVGLTNPGIKHWIQKDLPMAHQMGYKIAASIKPNNPQEAQIMADLLSGFDLAYVEVNVSCPNVEHIPDDIPTILKSLKERLGPIVLKLSVDQVTEPFIKATEEHVEAFHAINTIPWKRIFSDKKSPIECYGHKQQGGVSGSFIKHEALRCVREIKGWTSRPVIAGGGILKYSDVFAFEAVGADAYSLGTCFLLSPWRPNQIVRDYRRNIKKVRQE